MADEGERWRGLRAEKAAASAADPRPGKRGGWRGYPPKTPERDAEIARRCLEGGETRAALALAFGLSRQRVQQIVDRAKAARAP